MSFKLKVTLYESISTNETLIKDSKIETKVFLKTLVCNNQYVVSNTAIAKVDMVTRIGGTFIKIINCFTMITCY